MARPLKTGLSYFPFDVDFFTDIKIKRLRARYGTDGIAVYIYILCQIYRSGYYVEYNDDFILDISDELKLSENSTTQIVNYLFSRSLLQLIESTLAVPVKVVTAASVQRRYQEAKKGAKRDIEVESEFWVLKNEETESFIKVRSFLGYSEKNYNNSEKNYNKSEKNHTKKSKVKESKENESEEAVNRFTPPTLEAVQAYCIERKNSINPERFISYYSANGWRIGSQPMQDWRAAVRSWESNGVDDRKNSTSDQSDDFDVEKYKAFINQF